MTRYVLPNDPDAEELSLGEALDELQSAEDFLTFFAIDFDSRVVQVNRLHILQRYHDYLAEAAPLPDDDDARAETHRRSLTRAYTDFVSSNAQAEKVFKVFKDQELRGFVSIDNLTAPRPAPGSPDSAQTVSAQEEQ